MFIHFTVSASYPLDHKCFFGSVCLYVCALISVLVPNTKAETFKLWSEQSSANKLTNAMEEYNHKAFNRYREHTTMNAQTILNGMYCKAVNTHIIWIVNEQKNDQWKWNCINNIICTIFCLRCYCSCFLHNSNTKWKITIKNTINDRLWTVVLIPTLCYFNCCYYLPFCDNFSLYGIVLCTHTLAFVSVRVCV